MNKLARLTMSTDTKRPIMTLATLACAISISHASDGVDAMCLELENEEICSCASEMLRTELGDEDYGIYEAIGTDYLERLASGEGRAAAWTAASQVVADDQGISASALMKRTNAMGRAHREAIKGCAG